MGNFNSFTNCLLKGDSFGASRLFRKDFANRICDSRSGIRPIHLASRLGLIDIVRLLIDNDCDIECETNLKERPIHMACMRGHLDVAQALLDADCAIECETKIGRRPIHCACYNGNVDIVKLLINKSCDIECEQTNGRRPIHCACNNGCEDIVKLLIENDCDIECETNDRERPIHFASKFGHTDIVRLLVGLSCDVTSQTKDKKTPLDLALSNGHLTCAQVLAATYEQIDPLEKNERIRPTRRSNSIPPLAAPQPAKTPSTNKCGALTHKNSFVLDRIFQLPFQLFKNWSVKNELRGPFTDSPHSKKLFFNIYPIVETFKQAMRSLIKLNRIPRRVKSHSTVDSSLANQSNQCRTNQKREEITEPKLCLAGS